jgi:hypothetical protein
MSASVLGYGCNGCVSIRPRDSVYFRDWSVVGNQRGRQPKTISATHSEPLARATSALRSSRGHRRRPPRGTQGICPRARRRSNGPCLVATRGIASRLLAERRFGDVATAQIAVHQIDLALQDKARGRRDIGHIPRSATVKGRRTFQSAEQTLKAADLSATVERLDWGARLQHIVRSQLSGE